MKFNIDGVSAEVAQPEGLEFKKTVTGDYVAVCICGAGKVEVTEANLRAGLDQKGVKKDENKNDVAYEKALPSPLDAVLAAKRAGEILQSAPKDDLVKFMRAHVQHLYIIAGGATDAHEWPIAVYCPVCVRRFDMQVVATNPIKSQSWTFLDMLRKIPFKHGDSFTCKVIARISLVQGFQTPEKYMAHLEALLEDLDKIEGFVSKVEATVSEEKQAFKSSSMAEFIRLMESDLAGTSESLKKEIEKELSGKLKQIHDSSNVEFEDKTSLPTKIKDAIKNKLLGNQGAVAFPPEEGGGEK